MANNPYVNKVVFGNQTLIDLSTDTVASSDDIVAGKIAHLRDGTVVTGTASGGDPHGTIWQDGEGYVHLDDESGIALQTKTATPSESQQVIEADDGYYALESVTVGAISSSYVGSGVTRRSSSDLSASGATVTAPAGYYESSASKAVASGTAGTPTATKSAVSNHAVTVTPSVTNTTGYITGSTKTGTAVSVSASELVSGTYNVTSSGTKDVTNYASISVPSGTEGTPTATKGSVSNHSVSVTPSVTNAAGYIGGSTKTGTAVTVSASELVSGSQTVSQNGTVNVTNLAEIVVNVPSSTPTLITKNITENGTYNASSDSADGYSSVTVNVSGGGAEAVSMDDPVRFFDYDGTLLHSYSASDFQALTAMPSNPSHSGLTAQGWNWSLTNAKAQLTAMGACDIGQMYTTSDGKTRIYIHLEEGRTAPYLGLGVNGTVVIDWGDSTATSTLTGSSLTTVVHANHTYANSGDYVIAISVSSGTASIFGTSNAAHILKKDTSTTATTQRVYASAVKKVEIGDDMGIGNYAFESCYSLISVTIPNTVTSIGTYAFDNCYSLLSLTVANTVTSIGNYAFRYCYSLVSISMPNNIAQIGQYQFEYCYALVRFVIPNTVTNIYTYAFAYCYSLANITIPSGVTALSEYAFYYCYSLSKVILPSITNTSSYTFRYCYSLANITIPSTTTYIGNYAFNNCYGLGEIHFKPSTPPTVNNANAFSNVPTDCKIYVPTGKLSAYTSASNYPSPSTYTYIEE